MKIASWTIAAVLLIVASLVGYDYTSRGAESRAWKNQKWGEVADSPHGLTLKPGQWMKFGPINPTGGNIRYDVSSTLPLNTGLVASGGSWPQSATCFELQVLNSVKSCTVPATGEEWIFVNDSRNTGDVVGGVLLGNRNAADDSRVTVTTYHWGCVAQCVK